MYFIPAKIYRIIWACSLPFTYIIHDVPEKYMKMEFRISHPEF